MRTVSASIPLLGIVVALSLYGCSSDSGDDPTPPRSAGGAAVTAACSVAAPTSSAAPTSPPVDLGTVRGKVGVVLPRTSGVTRPSAADPGSVTRALRDYGVAVEMATRETDRGSCRAHSG